ncbi:TetR/AcrR family transcriptional regulator [Sphingobium sp. CR2-8]|uniref:TetR/AcrR family transcriptional regulator n=1 Tax=Sphingobium sp. CR2-8 TaxID=1306534 RepID=UPI002DBE0AE9|nr:TetR/AcrR family transcriptional regulator [Sphingobium sp. CR2-8]MEC3909567.1 TetR/AcrR family transcriptional regulator [Sphingobium sp. CR2-8]
MQQLNDPGERPLSALPPRERIRKTASDLFCRRSIHTVGIDRIIAESGVAKMTFYKHFPSKACLIADYLQSQTGVWMQMLVSATQRPGLSPVEQVLAIFDALDASFQQRPFRGCPFVKGMAEFGPDADAPEIQAMIDTYFESLHRFVTELIKPLSLIDPGRTAIQILSLIQGAIVMAQATSDRDIGAANRHAARILLEAVGV